MSVAALTAIVNVWATAPAAASRDHAEANFSYCGFGYGPAASSAEPGGGGDTFELPGEYRNSHHFMYDSSSPVTLAEHDRVVLTTMHPRDIVLKRIGDSLALCVSTTNYELFIKHHYCRVSALSAQDTSNHEVEEFRFIAAGEIWLSDVLYEAYQKDPSKLADVDASDDTPPPSQWRVRPFREVMPDYAMPATGCI